MGKSSLHSRSAFAGHDHRLRVETLEDRHAPGSLLIGSALLPMDPVSNWIDHTVLPQSAPLAARVFAVKPDVAGTVETKPAEATAVETVNANATVSSTSNVFASVSAFPDFNVDSASLARLVRPDDLGTRNDDRSVHTLGVLPGSSIKFKDLFETFGEDPPTDILQNVNVFPNGAMTVNIGDLPVISVTADLGSGITATGTIIWLSNFRGTYSQTTGKMTAKFRFQLHVTSNAPGFNNGDCKVPPVGISMSSDNTGGAAFLNGEGTIVDNTAVVNKVPDDKCGSFIFVDYSDEVNSFLNLPSLTSGDNVLSLHLRMTPSLPPP